MKRFILTGSFNRALKFSEIVSVTQNMKGFINQRRSSIAPMERQMNITKRVFLSLALATALPLTMVPA
jgi:hypothetical protein